MKLVKIFDNANKTYRIIVVWDKKLIELKFKSKEFYEKKFEATRNRESGEIQGQDKHAPPAAVLLSITMGAYNAAAAVAAVSSRRVYREFISDDRALGRLSFARRLGSREQQQRQLDQPNEDSAAFRAGP